MATEKFETSLKKLEEIVKRLEGGSLSLEESLKAFEEGVKHAAFCSHKLDEAERRVEHGALIGETALMADVRRRATAKANEDCEVLRVPGVVFRRVLSEFPRAAVKVRAAAAARTREFVGQLVAKREKLFEG